MAGAIWYLDERASFWPLLPILAVWAVGMIGQWRGWWEYRVDTPLDVPIMAFLLTTCVALWVTYDPQSRLTTLRTPVGLDKFWLIVGAVLIYYAFAHLPDRGTLWEVTFGMGLFVGVLGVYFLLTNDFTGQGAKFQWLWSLGVRIQKAIPNLGLHALHPNVMGGLIAMFLPSGLVSLAWAYRVKQLVWRIILLVSLILSLSIGSLALLLSMSRGAWVALAAGLLAWAGFAVVNQMTIWLKWNRRVVDRFLGTGLVVGGVLAIILAWNFAPQILKLFPPLGDAATTGQAGFGRYELMKAASQLVRDYPLTGIGLGTFPMVFSTYAILIQVPYIVHAHNLFLNLAISQGLPGLAAWLLALAGALVIAWRLKDKVQLPVAAAVAMLVVMLVHGLVDDPLYGSRAVLLWWVPVGLLVAQGQVAFQKRMAGFYPG